ncbi:MAG: NADH-quinone oxidoreductase subunit M, partial [Pirellulaceae bacterium]|nr:NADH-quinone oxidoreductase subunit M [Pirellulaceae bacterium]
MQDLLLITIFLPLLGAALMWVVAPLGDRAVRWTALGVALLTLALAVNVVAAFPADGANSDSFAVKEASWLGANSLLNVKFATGLDGLGVWMFGLSALLMVTAILVSWEAISDRPALFYGMLLLLEFGCLGVFCARDIILFYVFFEFTLIPLFFLIGVWGSEQRRYAAIKFFLFTLAGSVLTFLGLLALVYLDFRNSGGVEMRFSIPALTQSFTATPLPSSTQMWIFLALFAGFAIKVPLFPLHTWLPLAHVQAPTAGSVFLAGILLKIGTYGFLRFCLPMLPAATAAMMPWIMWLSVIGIIYGALVALVQSDMKRLIAYSSVSHLGYCMIGLFALNQLGVQGGALQMINHGISTGGLFAIVGMIYERRHTRQISELRGLARHAPWLAFAMLLFTFSSIGLPGMNGFAGEFLVLLGVFQLAFHDAPTAIAGQLQVLSVLAVSGVVLGAWYMLYLVQRVFFGPADAAGDEHVEHPDLKPR